MRRQPDRFRPNAYTPPLHNQFVKQLTDKRFRQHMTGVMHNCDRRARMLKQLDDTRRIAPFRYLRINACLRLPVAFRSLPRLSSASDAKAFALRPL